MDKERYIKIEIQRFKKIFKDIEEDKKPFAEKLYTQAAFMSATLNELQEIVKSEGAVITSINGNGFETKMENPAQKSYNVMIRNYNATIKSLIEMLPEGQETDDLISYIGGGKK